MNFKISSNFMSRTRTIAIIFCIVVVIIFYFQLFFTKTTCVTILRAQDFVHFKVTANNIHHAGSDAAISTVTDGCKIYILKQIVDPSLDEQFLLINDVIASTIGYRAGIHVNEVHFIPHDVAPHLKIFPTRAATLHHFIDGVDLEHQLPPFLSANFTVQQRVINANSVWQKKHPLPAHEQGLTQRILESMSIHPDLIAMVAFDTFVGNSDRSLPNILYNQKENQFYGIDQAAAFSKKLPQLAHERIQELQQNHYFNNHTTAFDTLASYKQWLSICMHQMTAQDIIAQLQKIAIHVAPTALVNNAVQERIHHHTRIIQTNYIATAQLIDLIDDIIKTRV